ncbi:hypothetical protein [Rufibacter latericius]|uniref:Uncharacterized protein n=1 Tax=Rufibacter latericius TaxID=2487040 RepID=A0A3M9MNE2_9BACT|nr:hypothetical protein [Rufibacter latericius]RNI27029.1 hypothetical protein EFB08_11240 [Rufibacter latericius]
MGFESKIYFSGNAQIQKEIQQILINQKSFYKREILDGHLNLEFRENKVPEGMPYIIAIIEEDGLYICQYVSSKTWNGTNEIISFLKKNKIDFRTEEI